MLSKQMTFAPVCWTLPPLPREWHVEYFICTFLFGHSNEYEHMKLCNAIWVVFFFFFFLFLFFYFFWPCLDGRALAEWAWLMQPFGSHLHFRKCNIYDPVLSMTWRLFCPTVCLSMCLSVCRSVSQSVCQSVKLLSSFPAHIFVCAC